MGVEVIDETLLEAEEKMEKAVAVAKEDFQAIRTGRVTPAMFNKITAEYYGTPTPINQLASFRLPEPRMVIVEVFDRSSMNAVEKAIRDSDLGVNPTNDGKVIRVVFPELSEGPSATSAAAPRRPSTSWPRTARRARTRSGAPRRSSTTSRTAMWRRSTSCLSTRRRSCSKFDGAARDRRAVGLTG